MDRVLITSIALLSLLSGSAVAADMGMPLKAPPPPAPTWSGCYVDAGGGYGMWNQDHNLSFAPPIAGLTTTVTTTDGGRGWLGRFGGGCDYQFTVAGLGNFVIGAFGDYDPMSLGGSNSPNEVFNFGGAIGTTPITANENETGAWYVGARLDYLITPSVLTYVDGGYTGTRFTQTAEFSTLSGAGISFGYPNFTAQGWFLGSGFEYALNMPWIPIHGLFLQTEYRYSQYGSVSLAETNLVTGAPTGNTEIIKPSVQTITTALVWRFNWVGQ